MIMSCSVSDCWMTFGGMMIMTEEIKALEWNPCVCVTLSTTDLICKSSDTGQPFSLTPTLLTWTIWWAPTNASKWRMGFNSAFKGLIILVPLLAQTNYSLIWERCRHTAMLHAWHGIWKATKGVAGQLRKAEGLYQPWSPWCLQLRFQLGIRKKAAVKQQPRRLQRLRPPDGSKQENALTRL